MRANEDLLGILPATHMRNPEEMRHVLLSRYGAHSFATAANTGFGARAGIANLGDVDVGFCAYDSPATVGFNETDFARVQFVLQGSATTRFGSDEVTADPTRLCVSTSGRPAQIAFEPGVRQLFIRVRTPALDAALATLLGATPSRAIVFDPAALATSRRAVMMRELTAFVARQLSGPALPALLQRELQSYVAVSFLMSFRSNYSELLEQDQPVGAIREVRLVEDYVENHYDQPITVEQLAAVSQISIRSLYLSFQRMRGYTPKAFVKTVRLRKAREQLLGGGEPGTVSAVALRCGFQNLGHFARDYRMAFGETPSQTLARARRNFDTGDEG